MFTSRDKGLTIAHPKILATYPSRQNIATYRLQNLVIATINVITFFSSRHLMAMAYSSWALPCPPLIARSSHWLPSSVQTRGRYSVASNPPQLHVARYGWVFLSVTSSPRETFGLLMRPNGDDLHLVNCGSGQRGAIFCRLWCDREAGNQRCVGLQYWSHGGCKVCGGSSEWPTCQTHYSMRSQRYFVVDHVSHSYSKTGTTYVW